MRVNSNYYISRKKTSMTDDKQMLHDLIGKGYKTYLAKKFLFIDFIYPINSDDANRLANLPGYHQNIRTDINPNKRIPGADPGMGYVIIHNDEIYFVSSHSILSDIDEEGIPG